MQASDEHTLTSFTFSQDFAHFTFSVFVVLASLRFGPLCSLDEHMVKS